MAASTFKNWALEMASSSFFAELFMVSLYMDRRFSLAAVCFVAFFLLAYPVFNRLEVGKVFKQFLYPFQFLHIKYCGLFMPLCVSHILLDLNNLCLFLYRWHLYLLCF